MRASSRRRVTRREPAASSSERSVRRNGLRSSSSARQASSSSIAGGSGGESSWCNSTAESTSPHCTSSRNSTSRWSFSSMRNSSRSACMALERTSSAPRPSSLRRGCAASPGTWPSTGNRRARSSMCSGQMPDLACTRCESTRLRSSITPSRALYGSHSCAYERLRSTSASGSSASGARKCSHSADLPSPDSPTTCTITDCPPATSANASRNSARSTLRSTNARLGRSVCSSLAPSGDSRRSTSGPLGRDAGLTCNRSLHSWLSASGIAGSIARGRSGLRAKRSSPSWLGVPSNGAAPVSAS